MVVTMVTRATVAVVLSFAVGDCGVWFWAVGGA